MADPNHQKSVDGRLRDLSSRPCGEPGPSTRGHPRTSNGGGTRFGATTRFGQVVAQDRRLSGGMQVPCPTPCLFGSALITKLSVYLRLPPSSAWVCPSPAYRHAGQCLAGPECTRSRKLDGLLLFAVVIQKQAMPTKAGGCTRPKTLLPQLATEPGPHRTGLHRRWDAADWRRTLIPFSAIQARLFDQFCCQQLLFRIRR